MDAILNLFVNCFLEKNKLKVMVTLNELEELGKLTPTSTTLPLSNVHDSLR